jgi:hypothetical protein
MVSQTASQLRRQSHAFGVKPLIFCLRGMKSIVRIDIQMNRLSLITLIFAFGAAFRVHAADTEPPQLVALGISPDEVNVSSSSATITITARITDNLAGNAGEGYTGGPSQIRFRSPSGNQSIDAVLGGYHRVSGTALDGEYAYEMTVPQYAESGTWTIDYVLLVDQIGNMRSESAQDLASRSLPTSFVVFYPQVVGSTFSRNAGFVFSWQGFAGRAVNVQRRSSFNDPWVTVSSNNVNGTFTDTNPPPGKAYYRVQLP